MRKRFTRILILTASLTMLGFAIPQTSAVAHHGEGHHIGRHCRQNIHEHNFRKETKDKSKKQRRRYKRRHRHHEHFCLQYPPSAARAPRLSGLPTSGRSATSPLQAPDSGGVTVGMITLVSMAGLGTVLIVRRSRSRSRWRTRYQK